MNHMLLCFLYIYRGGLYIGAQNPKSLMMSLLIMTEFRSNDRAQCLLVLRLVDPARRNFPRPGDSSYHFALLCRVMELSVLYLQL